MRFLQLMTSSVNHYLSLELATLKYNQKYDPRLVQVGCYQGKDIVFRSILEYSSLRDFCP
jgi:hypothetical protein